MRRDGEIGAKDLGASLGDLIFGVAAQYLLKLVQGPLILVLAGESDPKVLTGLDQFRLEAHRFGELRGRAGGVTVPAKFQTKTEMGLA